MDPALRARLFGTDPDVWHNKNYIYVGGPAFAVIGVLVGGAIALPMDLAPVHEMLIFAACAGLSIAIGLTFLAIRDLENDPESS